jgi:D-amino-acid oxidase
VASIGKLKGRARAIANCTGLGARDLVPDPSVRPVRGQLVVVPNDNGIKEFFQDNPEGDDFTYIFPHGAHIVLGGCAIEHAAGLEPDWPLAHEIVRRCTEIQPKLRGTRITQIRVGLRPWRSSVRVERTDVDGLPVIHNYGHGGAGLTLSWGCAAEVHSLLG